MSVIARRRASIVSATPQPVTPVQDFAADVLTGLSAQPKYLLAKYFYDDRGSQLFEAITAQPEYYPTRTEIGILRDHVTEIAQLFPPNCALIEFGSGSSAKTRILLRAAATVSAYVPVDISAGFLADEAMRLKSDCPHLAVLPVAADFTQAFALPAQLQGRPRVGFFPGSTIGNFMPHEAAGFLRHAARLLGPSALLIVGVDLVKDIAILHAAYSDAAGVTAAFNLNLLERINRELGAGFDADAFRHYAFFNQDESRVEMHLVSRVAQKVNVCSNTFDFRCGETIHTENSYKYTIDNFIALARSAGWRSAGVWIDSGANFSVHALIAAA
jgi:L-histidine Nalpha-methyltransferase